MAQSGPSDYRSSAARDENEGIMDQVGGTAREMGDRAVSLADDVGAAIRDHPYATLAIAAGLAFAVGALWKLGQQRPSRFQGLLSQMPELLRDTYAQRHWR
jgi:hypothetical protein